MAHKLYLGMFQFQIKKRNDRTSAPVQINDFLSKAYPDEEGNKFGNGFIQDIINLLDEKIYKNKDDTHGATLEHKHLSSNKRIFDLMLDGGITGIKQFIIDSETGKKTEIKKEDITGMKFFARIWMPSASKAGYIFIQSCGTLTIKPIFKSILTEILNNKNYSLIANNIFAITTRKRQKEFLKRSQIKYVSLISKKNNHSTNAIEANIATLKFTRLNIKGKPTFNEIEKAASNHGFSLNGREYEIKTTYEHIDTKEEKTVALDASDETINVIPNIIIPSFCKNSDNYPIFKEMQNLIDSEMDQIKKESK